MSYPEALGYESEERLWDAARTARYLGLSRQWVYRETGAGRLPHVRILGVLRFDPDDIRRLKDASKVVPGEVRPPRRRRPTE